MSSSDNVDMSQYREEQNLLQANRSAMPLDQNNDVSSRTLEHQSQSNAELSVQQSPQLVQNVPQQANPQANPVVQVNPPPVQVSTSQIFQNLLDILFLIYCIGSLILDQELSKFLLLWVTLYIINACKYGIRQPIHRAFITLISLWYIIILMYNHFSLGSLSRHQKVFVVLYSIEAIPLICKGCCACFCTCMCATCCICVCVGALISQAFQGFMENNKYKKVRETLCNKNLKQITDVQCPICLQTGNMMNTQACHHSFHPVCLQNWLKAHKTCPLCRAVLF